MRWQEYRDVVERLLQWIQHHTVAFEERKFPASYEEIEVRVPSPRPPPTASRPFFPSPQERQASVSAPLLYVRLLPPPPQRNSRGSCQANPLVAGLGLPLSVAHQTSQGRRSIESPFLLTILSTAL